MSWLPESKDHLPLTWWKGNPIYLSAFIALAAVASMILTSIWMAVDERSLNTLIFSYESWSQLHLWAPVTYLLVNPPDLFFVLSCYFFYRFGEAVERHLGRKIFVKLFVILWAVSPLLVTMAGWVGFMTASMGITALFLGVFVAFATLYPRVELSMIFFTVQVWIFAAIIVGVNVLQLIAARHWGGLFLLAGQIITAILYIRYEQGALQMPAMPAFKSPAPPRSAPVSRPQPKAQPKYSPAVDDILEKISRDGMHSLTEEERRVLDQASDELQKRKK